MPLPYVFIALICVAISVYYWNEMKHKSNRENADAATWANQKLPLIYKQVDASELCELATTELYENALKKLELHGNMWLGRTVDERKRNVYLWVWGKDEQMTAPDFTRWALAKLETERDIMDAFIAEKARNMKKDGVPDLVRAYTETTANKDFEPENLN